ncbi:MAG: type II secretion system F family protein [Paracholeplasma sp.]|nr:type II secretion system F family protein [Paracholeplasma sp.]MDY3195266.1 type II secretion system F family protein [Paracholeplasma sp.]
MELKKFKYLATNQDGKIIKGSIEAVSRSACTKYLQTKNYKIKNIKESNSVITKLNNISFGSLIKPKQLVFFLRQLGSLLKAGVNLLQALELLSLQQDSTQLRKVYFEVYQQVYNGFSFSKALSKRPKEFPNLLVQMVEVGEISGKLPSTLIEMAEYYEKQIKISNDIKGAVRMPLVYLGAALVISAGMLIFVFPNITGLFQAFEGAKLPAITQFFLDAGDFTVSYGAYIFIALVLAITLFVFFNKKSKSFHLFVLNMNLKMPIFGKLIQMKNQIVIANSLAQMLSSGINSMKALQSTKNILENDLYKNLIDKTMDNIEDGKPFSDSFSSSELIDPVMAKMLQTGERVGDVPKLMRNLAEYYNGISDLRVQQLKNAIQPILLIIVYLIVGIMILAIMLPMLSLGTQI